MTSTHASGPQKIFITDCEGPISKNDNAFELASHFIPNGNRLFTIISRYDDILADLVKRQGYKAGDTLKLVLPFLKAYHVTNEKITNFSSQNLTLMPGANEMLRFVRGFMSSYIVSTSYEHYMRALCAAVKFPFENVHCTQIDLDSHPMVNHEREEIRRLAEMIVKLPMLKIPKDARSLTDLPNPMQTAVHRLDEIFWNKIVNMQIGKLMSEVNPVGGPEKTAAIKDIVTKLNGRLENVIYVGDSITDVSAFQLVRLAGGPTVSFNGNSYAIREAEIAVLSRNAIVTAVLANMFRRFGKAQLMTFIKEWKPSTLRKIGLPEALNDCFSKSCGRKYPKIALVTKVNMTKLMRESTQLRKSVRGKAIGKLG